MEKQREQGQEQRRRQQKSVRRPENEAAKTESFIRDHTEYLQESGRRGLCQSVFPGIEEREYQIRCLSTILPRKAASEEYVETRNPTTIKDMTAQRAL
jgi:hypothetical protein